jgi:hypothetical protein
MWKMLFESASQTESEGGSSLSKVSEAICGRCNESITKLNTRAGDFKPAFGFVVLCGRCYVHLKIESRTALDNGGNDESK